MLKSLVKKMLGRDPQQLIVRDAYLAIVAQARQPVFYQCLGVPDTTEGRFDMIALHAFLVLERLGRESSAGNDFAQALFDEMFRDMDRSLREMGVGDLSVGKKVRKLAEAFYGRCDAYRSGIDNYEMDGGKELMNALARNIFLSNPQSTGVADMCRYVFQNHETLSGTPTAQLLKGDIRFTQLRDSD